MLARLKAENPANDVPLDRVIELLEPFFGPGTLEKWADSGLNVDQMGDVFTWTMAVYQGENPEAAGDPEDQGDPNS